MRKLIGICVAAAILVSMLAFTPLASVAAEPTKLLIFIGKSYITNTDRPVKTSVL